MTATPIATSSAAVRDDRILRATRLISMAIVPILLLAFGILYFTPDESGARFAWDIQPRMTAMFMGAGYLGGAYLFMHVAFGRRWHRAAAGFPAVATFTVAMLAATILHWERFDPGHFPFQVWLAMYVVTPFLVSWMWLRNRASDDGLPEARDASVPPIARWSLAALSVSMLVFAVASFVAPAWTISLWPWQLTPLTARVMAGWFALMGVAGLVIARETRWSAWRAGLQSIGLWHVLVLLAAAFNSADFGGGLLNWYLVSVALALLAMASLYLQMERRRRRGEAT